MSTYQILTKLFHNLYSSDANAPKFSRLKRVSIFSSSSFYWFKVRPRKSNTLKEEVGCRQHGNDMLPTVE